MISKIQKDVLRDLPSCSVLNEEVWELWLLVC
jgi:hypothetical protein